MIFNLLAVCLLCFEYLFTDRENKTIFMMTIQDDQARFEQQVSLSISFLWNQEIRELCALEIIFDSSIYQSIKARAVLKVNWMN